MSKDKLLDIIRSNLADLMNEPGSILYSDHLTLKPGLLYLLGFNPGGSGGNSLSTNLVKLLNNQDNAYLDECWNNRNGSWEKGQAPLQKRVCWLMRSLGFNPREVCASNLIFFQSRKSTDINFNLAKICWPVHEAILEIVKPRLIITFGNSNLSPYRYLHNIFNGKEEYYPSGHGEWRVKGFETSINNRETYVVGLPHLSRYNPIGRDAVLGWLKSKI